MPENVWLIFLWTVGAAFGLSGLLWLAVRAVAQRWEKRRAATSGTSFLVEEDVALRTLLVPLAVTVGILLLPKQAGPLLLLVGVLSITFASVLHGVPGSKRSSKYAFLLTGFALVGGAVGRGRSGATSTSITLFSVSWIIILVSAAALYVSLKPNVAPASSDPATRRAIRLHRFVTALQGPDVVSMLAYLALLPVFGVYLALRYLVILKMMRRPVVYFRSFGAEGAPDVFATVVTPAIYRYAQIVGLVHAAQPSWVLNKRVPLFWRARFYVAADTSWRDWVERSVERALAVVVDYDPNSASVAWELDLAVARLGPGRVVAIHRADVPPPFRSDVRAIAYRVGDEGARSARLALATWISEVTSLLTGQSAPPAVARLRRQLPMLALIWAYLGVLFAPAAYTVWQHQRAKVEAIATSEANERAVRAAEARARTAEAFYRERARALEAHAKARQEAAEAAAKTPPPKREGRSNDPLAPL